MMRRSSWRQMFAIASFLSVNVCFAQQSQAPSSVQVPALDVPYTVFGSAEAKTAFERMAQGGGGGTPANGGMDALRRHYAEGAIKGAEVLRAHYGTTAHDDRVGGVAVRVIDPRGGAANADAVLLCIHGGSFMWGELPEAEVEAIPLAAESRLRVIGVDYREAPEHVFPAAVDDVVAVYKELLKQYRADRIGIYGGSAGAVITGETVAALLQQGLPVPGAIGLFNGALTEMAGDSVNWGSVLTGQPPIYEQHVRGLKDIPYFAAADMNSASVLPGNSPELLKKFPPALLLSGSRDFALGGVLRSERLLSQAGVSTELHVWDGISHTSFGHVELPETQQEARFAGEFFRKHLVTQHPARKATP